MADLIFTVPLIQAIQSVSLQFQFFFVALKIWSLCEALAISLARS